MPRQTPDSSRCASCSAANSLVLRDRILKEHLTLIHDRSQSGLTGRKGRRRSQARVEFALVVPLVLADLTLRESRRGV